MSTLGNTVEQGATTGALTIRSGRRAAAVVVAALATALAAQVSVPLPWTPVPMTLQPLLVLLSGALLGAGLGAASMSLYLVLGILGAPVFSGGGAGLLWLAGPTGGYLLAFPAAAGAVGLLAGPPRAGSFRLATALVAGLALIYVGGMSQLAIITERSWGSLASVAVLPFLAGDLLKVLVALALARPLRPRSLGRL